MVNKMNKIDISKMKDAKKGNVYFDGYAQLQWDFINMEGKRYPKYEFIVPEYIVDLILKLLEERKDNSKNGI